ncbi:MAG: tRNA pseudouridine(38-40) synthase TruA [Bacteroidota bacterium]
MSRFFLEVLYNGTNYSGFQVQENANTIQAEVEKAMEILLKDKIVLTGSSRTDAGVHAIQNFFHFNANDMAVLLEGDKNRNRFVYKMNAVLPPDIAIKNIVPVAADAHCRFDAVSREYNYYLSPSKNPFLRGRTFFFPYRIDRDKLQQAAAMIKDYQNFSSFSKRKTQVKTFLCRIEESRWVWKDAYFIYNVRSNRFLRGMVRGLTATMLRVGRNKMSLDEFRDIIEAKDSTKASFDVPPDGLFLVSVKYN